MQMPRITGRGSPEQIFGSFTNKSGAASVLGNVVAVDCTTTRDGSAVIRPTTALLSAVAGVVIQAGQADGDPVLVGTYGLWNTKVKGKVGAGGATVGGDILIPVNGEDNLVFSAAGDGKSGFAVLCDADVAQDAAAALKKVFWRAC